eukprot:18640-Heterococcus_DN1.PRE.2
MAQAPHKNMAANRGPSMPCALYTMLTVLYITYYLQVKTATLAAMQTKKCKCCLSWRLESWRMHGCHTQVTLMQKQRLLHA